MRVVVVGGGIAGLTLASALDPERFHVTLVEAQPERAGVGSALGLWGDARRALDRLGVSTGDGARPTTGALRHLDGRRLVPLRGAGPVLMDRPALLASLEGAVPPSVRRVSEEILDPRNLDADLVVGADGVRSRVRGLVEPQAAERLRTPYLALRGIADEPATESTEGEYWGDGKLFGIAPMSADRTYWFSTHRSELDEPLDPADALAEARDRFAAAAPQVRGLLDSAGPDTLATRLWVAPPMRRYVRGRYIVIGDAAHAMTPNLGRGACSAVIDAVTLADTLIRGRDLRWWQARRVPATQAARVGSAALMRLALRGGPA